MKPFLVIHHPKKKEHNDNISFDINQTFNSTSPYKKEEDCFDEVLLPKDFINKKRANLINDDLDIIFSNLCEQHNVLLNYK